MNITVFGPVWIALFVIFEAAVIVFCRCNRNKSREWKLRFMQGFSLFSIIYLLVYKVWLLIDPGYETNLLRELPLNLCNLSLPISFFAAKKDKKVPMAFLFYCCTLGAILALVMPEYGFYDVPFYLPRCIGYWGFHMIALNLGTIYILLGLYQPRLRDIPGSLLVLVCVALFCHLCNFLLLTFVHSNPNYCYTYGLEGNPLTELLMQYIPIPFVYLLPMAIPLAAVDCVMCGLANLGRLGKKKSVQEAEFTK